MTLLRSVEILGSLLAMVALAGCSSAARDVSGNTAPLAKEVTLSSSEQPARVGAILQGSYRYVDTDDDDENGTLMAWLRDGEPIKGANQDKYAVTAQDSGKNLQFRVTPAATRGKSPGEPAVSPGIMIKNSPPSITGLMLLGATAKEAHVGEVLSASYTFNDIDLNTEKDSEYQWLRSGKPINGAIQYFYTVALTDIGASISVKVTPKDNENNIGTSMVTAAVNVVNMAPVASNVRIIDAAGSTPEKRVLAALYDYADHEGDPTGTPLYAWKRSGILVASTPSYVLSLLDAGRTVSVEITPVALRGELQGTATAASTALDVLPVNVALHVKAGLKQLQFSWAPVPGATSYHVNYTPDGVSGFVPLSAASSNLLASTYDWDISVHRIDWPKAQFRLEVCDTNICLPSASISALAVMLNTIGYFKASNVQGGDFFGSSVALSADGKTLAVNAPSNEKGYWGACLCDQRSAERGMHDHHVVVFELQVKNELLFGAEFGIALVQPQLDEPAVGLDGNGHGAPCAHCAAATPRHDYLISSLAITTPTTTSTIK